MNRRAAVRTLLYIAGGALVLPASLRASGKETIALTNLTVNETDELLLEELVETLIPATDTPGGRELLLHLFVMKMVDDCHSPQDQKFFTEGLSAFADWSQKELGTKFASASQDKRVELLKHVTRSGNENISKFYGIMKRRTVQGYMNSEYVMTNLVKYELVPGRYNGYAKA